MMNWDQIEGNWKQYTGNVQEKWGKLTDDDLKTVAGIHRRLVGKIQQRYGIANAEARNQLDDFVDALE